MSEIDNDIKKILTGYTPPFDPDHWADMEKLLDKKKEKKGFWLWFFWTLLILGAASGGGYIYFLKSASVESNLISTSSKESPLNRKNTISITSTFDKTKTNKTTSESFSTPTTKCFSNKTTSNIAKTGQPFIPIITAEDNVSTTPINTTSLLSNHAKKTRTKLEHTKNIKSLNKKNNGFQEKLTFTKNLEQTAFTSDPVNVQLLPLGFVVLTEKEVRLNTDTLKQNEKKTRKQKLRWYIDANGGINIPIIKHYNYTKLEPEVSLRLGLQYKWLRCFAGIGYSNINLGFDLKKDNLSIKIADSISIVYISSIQHYLNVPIGLNLSIFQNNKIDLFVSISMINRFKISYHLRGTYKMTDNNTLIPDNYTYSIRDIKTETPTDALLINPKENVNEFNQMINSPVLSKEKYYVCGNFGIGLSYKINPFLHWSIEGKYTISPKLNNFYGNKMSIGGLTSIRYYFK